MRGEATNRVLLGRKSPGCPAEVFVAVGTIWGASKLGGRNITKYLQPRKSPRTKSFKRGNCGKPTHFSIGEGRWHRGRNRREHTVYRRGRGSSIQEKTVGDNVGQRQAKSRKGVQRRSVADLVSESLTRGNCPVDAVVISTSRKGDRPV